MQNQDIQYYMQCWIKTQLKYAYTLDILIPHFVHMTYLDYTLSILQNFEKTIFEELAKCSQNISCGQCEVSKCLVYRHILKWVCTPVNQPYFQINFEETRREKPKIQFF